MIFNGPEYHAVKKEGEQYVESIRPPAQVRHQRNIAWCISDRTIDTGQLRPVWQSGPGEAHNPHKLRPFPGQMEFVPDARKSEAGALRGNANP